MAADRSPLVVLMSTLPLARGTNPYSTMLVQSLEQLPDVRPESFSWRRALTGRFDVWHLHWPESKLRGRSWWRTLVRQLLFVVVLLRIRWTRRAIVRTVHNVELPSGLSRRERWILLLTERWTTHRIRLNEHTPVPPGATVATIEHGHYRDWFAEYPLPSSVPGRIAFFGLIRRYKSVGELARAFAATAPEAPDASLHISGLPSSPELAGELTDVQRDDPRITLTLRRIDDDELVREVGEAELVVLPYPEMHNSGAVLTTLSLGRPVLVPDNDVNRELSDEVGAGWLVTYTPPLTASVLLDALAAARAPRTARPDLSTREWSDGAAAHRAAYRAALARVGRR